MNEYHSTKIESKDADNIECQFDKTDTQNMKKLNQFITELDQQTELVITDSSYLYNGLVVQHNYNDIKCHLNQCQCLKRMTNILKRYHRYISKQQQSDADQEKIHGKSEYSIYNIYPSNKYNNSSLLNDFNHLIFYHCNDFEDIHTLLISQSNNDSTCSLSKCLMVKRNGR
eukprot:33863_1